MFFIFRGLTSRFRGWRAGRRAKRKPSNYSDRIAAETIAHHFNSTFKGREPEQSALFKRLQEKTEGEN